MSRKIRLTGQRISSLNLLYTTHVPLLALALLLDSLKIRPRTYTDRQQLLLWLQNGIKFSVSVSREIKLGYALVYIYIFLLGSEDRPSCLCLTQTFNVAAIWAGEADDNIIELNKSC